MKVTAQVVRSGKWWAVSVPEVEGVLTQARNLKEVPAMVADAVHLLDGVPIDDVEVELKVELDPDAAHAQMQARQAIRRSEQAAQAQKVAAKQYRDAIAVLRARGYSLHDVGFLLGISFQRVSALARQADHS
jgi:predicted RNase H-like HicB family nuclease